MAFEDQAGVQLSPFHLNPQLSGEILAAVLGALQEQRLRAGQKADIRQGQQNVALNAAQLLGQLGATQAVLPTLESGGVGVPAGAEIPPSPVEERNKLLETFTPETRRLLDRVRLLGPIGGVPPRQMQQVAEQLAGIRLTPFEEEQIAQRKQGLAIEQQHLDVERLRATTDEKRAGIDDRQLQLQIGQLLAGSVPGIDPLTGNRVSQEEFDLALPKVAELMSIGAPIPGNLWSKILPTDKAAAIAKASAEIPPELQLKLDILKMINKEDDPSREMKVFAQKAVNDIWAWTERNQPKPIGEAKPKTSLFQRMSAFFSAAMESKISKSIQDVISSNVNGVLNVAGTRELRPANAPEARNISAGDRSAIVDVMDAIRATNPPDALVRAAEAKLVEAAASGDQDAFNAAIEKAWMVVEKRGGNVRTTP